jgi:hypothetical protein
MLQHHKVIFILIVIEVVDLDDMVMAQLGHSGGFLLEAADEIPLVGKVWVDDLNRNFPP